jgi:acid phosphatase
MPKIPTQSVGSLHRTVQITGGDVRIYAIGDMGREGPAQAGVANAMEILCQQQRPDALVFLGDNIYDDGVESVDDPGWQTKLMQYYQGDCISQVPIYAIVGNHDYSGSVQAQIDYSLVNTQWNMPFRFYDVSFGDLLSLTVMDGWYPNYCFGLDSECAVNFMLESIEQNKSKTWRLVASHYPIRSASAQSSNHSGGVKGKIFERILCATKTPVTAFLAGHAHHLEHSKAIGCDMDLIVSGAGGGSDLYAVNSELDQSNYFVQSVNGFAEIYATSDSIQYALYDSNANQIYLSVEKKVLTTPN